MNKKQKKRLLQERLLQEHFGHQTSDFYEEKRVGESFYVKMYNKSNDNWIVAIYSPETFRKYKSFQQNKF